MPPGPKEGIIRCDFAMKSKWKYVLGGIVVFIALGALLYRGFQGSAVYYYTLPELRQNGASLEGSLIRVAGNVGSQSIAWDAATRTTTFTLVEGEADSLQVVYRGAVPDAFKAGGEVVVEGKYSVSGPFEAAQLISKCPSRYVPKT